MTLLAGMLWTDRRDDITLSTAAVLSDSASWQFGHSSWSSVLEQVNLAQSCPSYWSRYGCSSWKVDPPSPPVRSNLPMMLNISQHTPLQIGLDPQSIHRVGPSSRSSFSTCSSLYRLTPSRNRQRCRSRSRRSSRTRQVCR